MDTGCLLEVRVSLDGDCFLFRCLRFVNVSFMRCELSVFPFFNNVEICVFTYFT